MFEEFPGSLVVRTWRFHCQGLGSIPGQGTKILQASQLGQKNKDEKKDVLKCCLKKKKDVALPHSPYVGDLDSISGLGRSPGGGHSNPLQYSCLENPHGQRCLVGSSPWGYKESGTTE